MGTLFKKILLWLIRVQIRKYKPMIIGITGNAGKTSTKEAIAAVITKIKKVRVSEGNLNNEYGFALTFLGNWDEEYYNKGSSWWLWMRVFFTGLFGLIFPRKFPEVFLIEYGADHPGDVKRLAQAVKPHIAVVTSVGDIPVHVEFFQSAQALAKEKSELVKCLVATDHAVFNYDDEVVLGMREKTRAKVHTFGFGENADIRASDFNLRSDDSGKPLGVTFKLNQGEHTFVPVKIDGSLGKSQAWSASAAACVGNIFGMNLVQISEALGRYHGPKGRLKIINGIKNSVIIDDTYNASPASTHLALETLKEFDRRKIVVLGDMLELGEFTEIAHREVGNFAATFVDIFVCVGARMMFAAEAALNQIPKENIYRFDTSDEAKQKVQELIQDGDLILIKGSQGVRMEKICEEIMAEPLKKKELLVRQSQKWLTKL